MIALVKKILALTGFTWYPSPYFLAQSSHFQLGALSVLAPYIWGSWWWALIGTGAVTAYMMLKEFTFDIWVEKEDVEAGWKDMFWFGLGIVIAWVNLAVREVI